MNDEMFDVPFYFQNLKRVNTAHEVQWLDEEKSKNLVTIQSIKLTIAAGELSKVTDNLHNDLKEKFWKMLQTVIEKSKRQALCSTNLTEMLLG